MTKVIEFSGKTGAYPGSKPNKLVIADDGFIWGVTSGGGADDAGTVFKINSTSLAFTKVLEFTTVGKATQGNNPSQPLAAGPDGCMWGINSLGGTGTNPCGTIFKIDRVSGALNRVMTFDSSDPVLPATAAISPLAYDGMGSMWGTVNGTASGSAITYKVDIATGTKSEVFRVSDRGYPTSWTADENGCFWTARLSPGGSTGTYGNEDYKGGVGEVIKVNIATGQQTVMANWSRDPIGSGLPRSPMSGMTDDGNGFFWGTSFSGGTGSSSSGDVGTGGTVYKIEKATGNLTVMASLGAGLDTHGGARPSGRVVTDSQGTRWGTTTGGGKYLCGTIYRIPAGKTAPETVFEFSGTNAPLTGSNPQGLTFDSRGLLWGTTLDGGGRVSNGSYAQGLVFKFDPTTLAFTIVERFDDQRFGTRGPLRGSSQKSVLVPDGNGMLWGTTSRGTSADGGSVFRIDPITGTAVTVIEFTGSSGANIGNWPTGTLSLYNGMLWGTTAYSSNQAGTLFKINPATGVRTTVRTFDSSLFPITAMTLDDSGWFWGIGRPVNEWSSVFKVNATTGALINSSTTYSERFFHDNLAWDGVGSIWAVTTGTFGQLMRINRATMKIETIADFTNASGITPGSLPTSLWSERPGEVLGLTYQGGVDGSGAPAGDGQFFRITTVPELTVEEDGAPLSRSRMPLRFGMLASDGKVARTLTLRNSGATTLTGLSVSKSGSDTAQFTVSSLPATTLASGATMNLVITFANVTGYRYANLSVSSSDSYAGPFTIDLEGNRSTAQQTYGFWTSGKGMTSPDNGALANPAKDQVPNLIKYAFNLDPLTSDTRQLVRGTGTVGLPAFAIEGPPGAKTFTVEYLRRRGSGLIYTPKRSTNLASNSFTAMSGTETVTTVDSLWERVVVKELCDPVVTPRLFGRIDVSLP
ncbi:MAG: hypothetical protein QM755_05265 [Luteolibacter sp.]